MFGRTTRRRTDRKSTRLNSSHLGISYAVFCLKKNSYRSEAIESGDQIFGECERTTADGVFDSRASPVRSSVRCELLPAECFFRRFFFFNVPGTPDIYPLSLHDAFPI